MRQGRAASVTEPGIWRILAPARAAILHTARLSQEPRPVVSEETTLRGCDRECRPPRIQL